LTGRERVLITLEHTEPDRVPLDLGSVGGLLVDPVYFKTKELLGINGDIEPYRKGSTANYYDERLLEKLGIDFRHLWLISPDKPKSTINTDGTVVDEWGITWSAKGSYPSAFPLRDASIEEIENYAWPIPDSSWDVSKLRERARFLFEDTDYAVVAKAVFGGGGIFERCYYLRSIDTFLVDMGVNKDLARYLVERVMEVEIALWKIFLEAVGPYVHVVQRASDLGTQLAPFISPALFREILKPFETKVIQYIKQTVPHAKLWFHSCGAVSELIDDFIDMGIDILNPVQPLARIRSGGRLCTGTGKPHSGRHACGKCCFSLPVRKTVRAVPACTEVTSLNIARENALTEKQRILALIDGKKTDICPYHFDLTLKIKHKIAAYYGIQDEEVEKFIGNHLLYLGFKAPEIEEAWEAAGDSVEKHESGTITFDLEKVDKNTFVDEFGVTWNNTDTYETGDWGMVGHPVKNMDLSNYTFPDGRAPGRFRGVEEIIKQNPNRFNVLLMTGILDTAWHVTGIQDLLTGMALEDKHFINTMLDAALDFNLGVIEQVPSGFDGIRFLEDWAGQEGLFMGLKNWRTYLKPRLKIMYAETKKKGLAVMSHSDGNITEVFPDLIEMGVDISDPTQPEVMDLAFIKKEYGKDIVLFGGLGCQSTIPLGTPEDVVREARERLELLGAGGKYLLGPSGSIPTDAPIENVAALIEFCKGLGGKTL